MYMLNIFAIFSLLLAPIDGVIPLIFQSVHRFLFVSISIYKECMFISQVSLFEWFEGGSLKKTCSDPPVLAWTRLSLMFSFGLVCLSCFFLGFLGVFFFCFVPATHFSAIPPLQDSHSVGVCIDLASVWWTLNFSFVGNHPHF